MVVFKVCRIGLWTSKDILSQRQLLIPDVPYSLFVDMPISARATLKLKCFLDKCASNRKFPESHPSHNLPRPDRIGPYFCHSTAHHS